jgi:hypothetical protein
MSGRILPDDASTRHDYSVELTKGWAEPTSLDRVAEASEFVEFRPITGRAFLLGQDPLVTVGGGNLLLRYPDSGVSWPSQKVKRWRRSPFGARFP